MWHKSGTAQHAGSAVRAPRSELRVWIMESRAGVAPTWMVLQTIASAARPTGRNENQEPENPVPECRPFDRIRRVLPDAASRRFHATRPKPQSRKPAWLPFYTGGDSSLQPDLSAFIFRLPCGQQREQPHRANPTDLRRPCGITDALIVQCTQGLSHFRPRLRTRLCVQMRASNPQPSNSKFDALPLS